MNTTPVPKKSSRQLFSWLAALLLALLMTGCAAPGGRIADLAELPQAPSWYEARVPGAQWEAKPGFQHGLANQWRKNWYAPWFKPDPQAGAMKIKADGEKFLAEPGFGENLLARQEPYYLALIDNCSWENYPNAGWKGITLGSADLRLLPTARPTFSAPESGPGFPFDRLQQTSLPPNAPLVVHHQTRDRAWLLVQSPIAWGWLEASKAASMSEAQIRQWTGPKLLVITGQQTDVRSPEGRHLFKSSLGSVLPWAGESGDKWQALTAAADHKGRAVLITSEIEKKNAAVFPLALTSRSVAELAESFMGQAYGWGGLFGGRDCSALVRDLFAAYGLWLPRNSTDQAQQGGRFIDLAGLSTDEKKQTIQSEGIPFLSLVWLQGHIMLYVGAWQNEPLAMHNIWGIRTTSGQGLIGRTVITTLEPGRERPDLDLPEGLLINRVIGLTLLAPQKAIKNTN